MSPVNNKRRLDEESEQLTKRQETSQEANISPIAPSQSSFNPPTGHRATDQTIVQEPCFPDSGRRDFGDSRSDENGRGNHGYYRSRGRGRGGRGGINSRGPPRDIYQPDDFSQKPDAATDTTKPASAPTIRTDAKDTLSPTAPKDSHATGIDHDPAPANEWKGVIIREITLGGKSKMETDLFKPNTAAIDTQRKLISNAMRPNILFYLEVLKEQIFLLRNIVLDEWLKDETSGRVRRRRNEAAHVVADTDTIDYMSRRSAECAAKWMAIFEAYYGIE
ncbi:hypothetical protein SI65_02591 [Aspergillus cristatus]|uniref:Uncharacterized protein n=1 Tax=Aspergillus cristatus TaxID=573508 RepID=A0A1E3BLG6_ASPCR|nr:hypothetical protein SI65_02591 [Aspergillus cristatus]